MAIIFPKILGNFTESFVTHLIYIVENVHLNKKKQSLYRLL